MGVAFGWSSPLADEVVKLQLTAASAAAPEPAALGPSSDQLVGGDLALLPTLGRDLREPSQQVHVQEQAAALAPPPADQLADVITALPADLSLDLAAPHAPAPGPVVGQPFHSPTPPPPSASPPPFPGGLFPATSASWQAQLPSKVSATLLPHRRPCPAVLPSASCALELPSRLALVHRPAAGGGAAV